jgi:hypothetical protein
VYSWRAKNNELNRHTYWFIYPVFTITRGFLVQELVDLVHLEAVQRDSLLPGTHLQGGGAAVGTRAAWRTRGGGEQMFWMRSCDIFRSAASCAGRNRGAP